MAQADEQVVVTLVIRADAKSAADAQAKLKESARELGVELQDVTRKVEGQRSTYDKMMRALDPVYAGMKRLEGAEKALAAEVERGRITLDQKSRALDLLKQKLDLGVTGQGRYVAATTTADTATKMQSYRMLQLGQQFQDFSVQVAGGQNALLAFAQQGSQVAFLMGGFGATLAALGNVIRAHPILAIAATIATVVSAFFLLRDATKDATDAAMDHAAALEKANDALATSAERAARDAAMKRNEAESLLEASRKQRVEELAGLEAQVKKSEEILAGLRDRLAKENGPLGNPEIEAMIEAEIDQLTRLKTEVFELGGFIRQTEGALLRFKVIARGVAGDEATGPLSNYLDLMRDAPRVIEKARTNAEAYRAELDRLNAMHQFNFISAQELAAATENLNNWYYESSDAAKAAAEQGKYLFDVLKQTEKVIEDARKADEKLAEQFVRKSATATEAYAEQVANLDRLLRRDLLTTEEYARSVENLNQWLQEQDPAFQKAKKAAEDYAKELERVVGRTTDRMVDFGADAFFDVLEGRRDDFWASMVTTAKRAFAQMAAEALLRPIFLPIVQSVVGSAPGMFGIQQPGASPFSWLSAAGDAANAASFFSDPVGKISNIVSNIFSPNNFIASAFPSLFGAGTSAAALGIGAEFGLATTVGAGTLATGAGGLGVAAPLAGLAPFLPVLAIALPFLLSSLLGGKKSVGPNANAIINWERDADGNLVNPGGLAIGGLGADNGGDRERARSMAEAATEGFNTIVSRLGGRATGVPGTGLSGQLELGYFAEGGRHFSMVGGEREEFGSAEEAVGNFIRRALQKGTIEGLSEDVRLAIGRSTVNTVENLGKDLDFAHGFRRQAEIDLAGPGTRAAQLLGFSNAGADAALALREANRTRTEDARRIFGEDSEQMTTARAANRARALAAIGLGPDAEGANAPLEGMAAAIAQTRANFEALKETLVDTGLTAAEADAKIGEGLTRAFGKMLAEFDGQTADALLAAASPAAAQAKALIEAQNRRRADRQALVDAAFPGVAVPAVYTGPSDLDRLDRIEGGAALIGLTLDQLAEVEAQMRAIGEASPGMREALAQAKSFAGFVEGFGAMQIDIARWTYEAQQAAQLVTDAEEAATAAKTAYIDALDKEAVAQQHLADTFTRLAATMRSARLGLLIDQNLSPLNPQDRLTEARSQFENVYARAQLGDAAAMEQLPGISRAFLESSKAFNTSSAAYFADFSRVQAALANTETIAERQARIANDQLSTLRATLAEIRGQSANILTIAEAAQAWKTAEEAAEAERNKSPGPGAIGAQQKAAFDKLAGDFNNLYGGAATQGERDQIYQAAAQQRDALLGAITDISTLQAIGKQYYAGNTTDSGAIFLRSRLYSLNAVPQFEMGGQHYGGLRLVGERGMELEATGPARYFSTDTTIEMLRRAGSAANDGALLAAVRTMCQLMAEGNGISREAARAMVARLDDLIDGQRDHRGSLAEERARAA